MEIDIAKMIRPTKKEPKLRVLLSYSKSFTADPSFLAGPTLLKFMDLTPAIYIYVLRFRRSNQPSNN